jgi:hypothetical protein
MRNTRRHIELGVKGEAVQASEAFAHLCDELKRLNVEFNNIA